MILSVITVNLNNAAGLALTAESICRQTFSDYEWLVIDGGSSDGSVEVINKYSNHILYWVSETDTGIYNAMNKGLTLARGKYVLFLNSGDYLISDTVLQEVFDLNVEADIIYGDFEFVDNCGRSLGDFRYNDTLCFSDLYIGGLPHNASFISRQLLLEHPFNEGYKLASDWEFFVKMALLSRSFKHIEKKIIYYNNEGRSTVQTGLNKKERSAIVRDVIPQSIVNDFTVGQLTDLIVIRNQHPRVWRAIISSITFFKRCRKFFNRI